MLRLCSLLVLLAVVAGCGETKVVREQPVVVSGGDAKRAGTPNPDAPRSEDSTRIAVVTHGQASSAFWAIVRTGVQAAARQMNAQVDYQAPDVYSLARMAQMIDAAVATKPDGLVVSIPEPGLAPAIRRAVQGRHPRRLDQLRQRRLQAPRRARPRGPAGGARGLRRRAAAGPRGGAAGAVRQPAGRQPGPRRPLPRPRRARCGRPAAPRRVLGVDDQSTATPRAIGRAVVQRQIDGHPGLQLAQRAAGGRAAWPACAARARCTIGTFDLGPDVLEAVRQGKLEFAVDQQPYLQGYLPIVMLVNRARYGLFPAQGDVVATGASFVTRANADKALELSRRSIR